MTDTPLTPSSDEPFRILSLDGGGAKGFYTLGVLREIEAMMQRPLYQVFNLVFGTSTGAIIAALVALGFSVDEIHDLYKTHVPTVMKRKTHWGKSAALRKLAIEVFGDRQFTDVKTNVGIVATKWTNERPLIFKGNPEQAHGRTATFEPGFGVPIAQAVQASCSAYPFFKLTTVQFGNGDKVKAGDGGFCANNPTLYAIADATQAMARHRNDLRVVSVGVGTYPAPKYRFIRKLLGMWPSVKLLQKVLEINTQSMEQLRTVLYKDVRTVRIDDTFSQPELATDLTEHNLDKLNQLRQRGVDSFARKESLVRELLT